VQLRLFGFGDLAGGPWGAGWIPSEPGQAALLGSGTAGGVSLELKGEHPDEPWHLTAGETELTLQGLAEPVAREPSDQDDGFDQLCEVTGILAGEAGRKNIKSLGWRCARSPLAADRLESVRQVAGWFEQHDGFALLAVRPKGARGQERDQLTATLFGPEGAKPVADPRLSTTYTGSEQPSRASVELWVDTENDPETQYPRRAVGEALAAPAQASAGPLALQARPFRWYSGGLEGAGMYLIGRPA
jgi:hypothetical protein